MTRAALCKMYKMTFFALALVLHDANAANKHLQKNFENPAIKFEGTWQVTDYDLRRFEEIPKDIDAQLKDEAAAFPVGQRIHFIHTGSAIMPGSINPITMKSSGPIGETLEMTLLSPYSEAFCKGYWSYVCEDKRENFQFEVMITGISNWKKEIPKEYAELWGDVSSIQYNLQKLSKSPGFEVWFTHSGDMMMMISIYGQIVRPGNQPSMYGSSRMGVRLKRIGN